MQETQQTEVVTSYGLELELKRRSSEINPLLRNLCVKETPMADAKKHVFLSYCRDNQAEVQRLRDDLITAGETIWWDQDIHPGHDWKFEVRKAMQNAYAIVLCLSKETAARTSSGIYPEAAYAIQLYLEYPPGSIFLIPVRLSPCDIPEIPIDATRTLNQIQYQNLFPSDNYAIGIQKLLKAIKETPHHP